VEDFTGQLAPDDIEKVFSVARSLLPAALAVVRSFKLDPTIAEDCLMEAAHLVLERLGDIKAGRLGQSAQITNVPGYIFTSYKHLVLAELRQSRRLQQVDDLELESMQSTPDLALEFERKLLIDEIIQHFDEQTRFIYDRLVLGYTYEEIVPAFENTFSVEVKANALRSRFSKAIQKIAAEIPG
jgi:DNA-directed RNA polymerase specialized sigma24 family protein